MEVSYAYLSDLFDGGFIMKRVKAACICQTLCFSAKDDVPMDYAAELVKKEAEAYKMSLDKNGTKYKIIEESVQPDGSIVIKIIKQYNQCSVGNYHD